jgi:hypothetical protein
LDLLLTGLMPDDVTVIAQVWHNLGNGTFTNIHAGLPGVYMASVALGDFDNDGKLDILLTGTTNGSASGAISQIWRNLGNGVFTNIQAGLPGVYDGSVALADFDKDGRLDILLAGWTGSEYISQIWRNLGNGVFSNINAGLPGVFLSSVAWGDYDNDGYPDILLSGWSSEGIPLTQVWCNLGNGTFTNIQAGLPGIHTGGSAAWGDFDNDGKLDILVTGSTNGAAAGAIAQIWRNLGNGRFALVNSGLPGVWYSSVAFGDFDHDGALDILLTGWDQNDNPISQVFRNQTPFLNSAPAAPTGLAARVTGNGNVQLNWNTASDAQTPAGGLSYNLRVGTAPGASDVVSPEADLSTGFRRLPQIGNAQERLSATVTNLTPGATYYWSVQAVDTNFAGSPFAPEASFTLKPSLHIQSPSPGTAVISWPAWAGNAILETSTSVAAGNSWQTVTTPPAAADGMLFVTNAAANGTQFYRLRKP